MANQFERITYETQDAIAVITINREASLNSMDARTSQEMYEAFASFRDDDSLRVAILTGRGTKSFSTGMDLVASLEVARGWSRPMTFTNWVSTDPVKHPEEPFHTEDLVSIDATRFSATPAWPGGFFASYHAYPYYPDGLRFQRSYIDYRTPDGRPAHTLRTYKICAHIMAIRRS